jgi:hypothetical protein
MAFQEVPWFDRNPETHEAAFAPPGLGPHAITRRLAYRCPLNRIALVHVLRAMVQRMQVSGAATWVRAYWEKNGVEILVATVLSDVVGDKDNQGIGDSMLLLPGETLEGYTMDSSGAGSTILHLSYALTEFDPYIIGAVAPEPRIPNIQEPGPKPDPVM